jgi:hypothetical protein
VASISRRTVLDAVVVAVILAALPHAIHRIVQTGDPYLFTERFFHDVWARLSGPGRLRFIVQPIVAMLLGAQSRIQDADAGLPPFLWALAFHGAHRRRLLKSAFASIRSLVAIAILLDVIS